MCGISGIAFSDRDRQVPLADLRIMNSWSIRRGPDDEGYWNAPGVGFAHRRLSIIDLSSNGRQPMLSQDGSAAIVFNGEIYDFLALRTELELKGAAFRGRNDTETLLVGFQTWGIDGLLERIDGMFAFALLDIPARVLYLVRDRLGQKPLYYSCDDKRLLFASDIRSIWATHGGLNIDLKSLDYYLAELSMPQPRTIWKEVLQVEPAHYCRVSLDTLTTVPRSYWSIPRPDPSRQISADQISSAIEDKLSAAVSRMKVSDVPIGCFLSGGIDSGLVATTFASLQSQPIRTYTIGFPGTPVNELAEAKLVANRCGSIHTELDAENVGPALVEEVCGEFGEPFADSSALPTFLVSRAIARQCKVVFSGDGGDEAFGGYWEYPAATYADDVLTRYPGGFRRALFQLGDSLQRRILPRGQSSGISVGHALDFALRPGCQILHREMGFDSSLARNLYSSAVAKEATGYARIALERQWTKAAQASIADTLFEASLRGRLLNDYLVKVDRASMASSVEVRVPFLDKALLEFAFQLPASRKLPGLRAKGLLRNIAEKRLGASFSHAPKKGFGIPLAALIRGTLRGLVLDNLSEEKIRARGFFSPNRVELLLQEHFSGRMDHTHRIWALLTLELWCRAYLDKQGQARAS